MALTLIFGALLPLDAGAEEPDRFFRGVFIARSGASPTEGNADRRFAPASVQKVFLAAAALHHLGPEYRIDTAVFGTTAPREGVLVGDLVVRAAGDPSWAGRWHGGKGDAPLRALGKSLRQNGLLRVTGDLVVDLHRFPGRAMPAGRPLSESAYAFGAPTSALAVDENAVEVSIAPGAKVGDRGAFAGPPRLRLINEIQTVGAERHGRGTVDFLPDWGTPAIRARGEYPISEAAYTLKVATPDPEYQAAEALRTALAAEGIAMEGEIRLRHRPSGQEEVHLATLRSPPLARLLVPVLEDSHNWYAEMILRQIALAKIGEGRYDGGLTLLRDFLTDVVGVPAESFVVGDASGLSDANLITPRSVAAVLTWAVDQPWFSAFRDALARPGKGTLEAWRRPADLAAKTGTLRHTHALAGYRRPDSENPRVFVIFLDHQTEGRAAAWREMVRLLAR
ncbi:MAG: D-alanyl-D-alanine carboxypeptidase/D-alanyl-D-alanine-endopeptidase [Acidobacteriota bacterium]